MAKVERLFAIMDRLRAHRRPVTAQRLAQDLGVSVRTTYRDVQTLIGLGAPIEGEAGLGYVLRPGFFLPPLMFDADELDALALGAQWVRTHAEAALAAAADTALGKIATASPDGGSPPLEASGLSSWPLRPDDARPDDARPKAAGPDGARPDPSLLPLVRDSLRRERAMEIAYEDEAGAVTRRTIWPVLLTYLQSKQVLVAWCALRSDFRLFRTDRIGEVRATADRFGRRRAVLRGEWEARLPQDAERPPSGCNILTPDPQRGVCCFDLAWRLGQDPSQGHLSR
jgi:predicted DNA-binding transcriptional regulator YafY